MILPRTSETETVRAVREAAQTYAREYGWAVFPQRTGSDGVRRSLPMCPDCRERAHDARTCTHRLCHGLYAATTDPAALAAAWDAFPDADCLCVRTGRARPGEGEASGLLVVDFDAKHDGPETHDRWPEVSGLGWTFPETLRQRTKSGGFHLVYRLPDGADCPSRNAVTTRGVDVKATGGLVVVAPSAGYRWLTRGVRPAEATPELLDWARSAPVWRARRAGGARAFAGPRGLRTGSLVGSAGLTLGEILAGEGCPAGGRDEFVNALVFQLRKIGLERGAAEDFCRDVWSRGLVEQPDGDEFRWEWVLYKIDHVWRTVEPDPLTRTGREWLASALVGDAGSRDSRGTARVTVVRRGSR